MFKQLINVIKNIKWELEIIVNKYINEILFCYIMLYFQ